MPRFRWPWRKLELESIVPERERFWLDWTPYLYIPPIASQEALIMIMREEFDTPYITRPCDMHPLMNVVGLYWTPYVGVNLKNLRAQ